jgi:hypothetical protein
MGWRAQTIGPTQTAPVGRGQGGVGRGLGPCGGGGVTSSQQGAGPCPGLAGGDQGRGQGAMTGTGPGAGHGRGMMGQGMGPGMGPRNSTAASHPRLDDFKCAVRRHLPASFHPGGVRGATGTIAPRAARRIAG